MNKCCNLHSAFLLMLKFKSGTECYYVRKQVDSVRIRTGNDVSSERERERCTPASLPETVWYNCSIGVIDAMKFSISSTAAIYLVPAFKSILLYDVKNTSLFFISLSC